MAQTGALKQLREGKPHLLCEVYPQLSVHLRGSAQCDVTLALGPDQHQLHAHQSVLASRSAVFAAMFAHDTRERIERQVVIADLAVPTAESMLAHIYTGHIPQFDSDNFEDIFIAADKVGVFGRICASRTHHE